MICFHQVYEFQRVIYDDSIPELATEEAREAANTYVSFTESRLRVRAGATR